jgi:chemotaxis protein methyltransferase CheR
MIYFDRPTQRQVLQRIHGVLKPGGVLFVGHSENFTEHRDLFTLPARPSTKRSGLSPWRSHPPRR